MKKLLKLLGITIIIAVIVVGGVLLGNDKVKINNDSELPIVSKERESESSETEDVIEPEIIEITITAVGDCTIGTNQLQGYENSFHQYYDNHGADYFLKNVRSVFEADDFTIINFEGVLTDTASPRTTKQYIHGGKLEYINVLTGSSVEAVTLGNNHIMDYNEQGVSDTIGIIETTSMEYALSGDWGNHYGIYTTDKGIKIGFVSVNEYYEGKAVYKYLDEGYEYLRSNGCEIVIAAAHWGGDGVHEVEQDQIDMGHHCIDLGYNLVIGCHPHVLQGIEQYGNGYIVYSMGNFCYGGCSNARDKDSMIFQAKYTFVDGELQLSPKINVLPCSMSSVDYLNDYCPIILEGEQATRWTQTFNEYCAPFNTCLDEKGHLTTSQ